VCDVLRYNQNHDSINFWIATRGGAPITRRIIRSKMLSWVLASWRSGIRNITLNPGEPNATLNLHTCAGYIFLIFCVGYVCLRRLDSGVKGNMHPLGPEFDGRIPDRATVYIEIFNGIKLPIRIEFLRIGKLGGISIVGILKLDSNGLPSLQSSSPQVFGTRSS
jgi:hypothetical protein